MSIRVASAPFYLIVGDEEYLISSNIDAVIAHVRSELSPQDATNLPINRMRASTLTSAEISELLSPTLFGEDRVIVLEEVALVGKETMQIVLSLVSRPAPGVTVIIVHSGGGRAKSLIGELSALGAQVFRAEKLTRRNDRVAFIRRQFESFGIDPPQEVMDTLLESVGTNLRALASAVSQLVADTGGRVDSASVQLYYAGVAEVSGFDIADAAVTGRLSEALSSLRWASYRGVSPILVADALGDAVLSIVKVINAGRINPSVDAAKLGMPPWKITKVQKQSTIWDSWRINEAVAISASLNNQVKGLAAEPEYALEQAVTAVALLARPSVRNRS